MHGPLTDADPNREPNNFRVQLQCRDFDITLDGHLPYGVVIEVRDYRLAHDAEPGTTVEDPDGEPHFLFAFGDRGCD